jgi:hypothetical protein
MLKTHNIFVIDSAAKHSWNHNSKSSRQCRDSGGWLSPRMWYIDNVGENTDCVKMVRVVRYEKSVL